MIADHHLGTRRWKYDVQLSMSIVILRLALATFEVKRIELQYVMWHVYGHVVWPS